MKKRRTLANLVEALLLWAKGYQKRVEVFTRKGGILKRWLGTHFLLGELATQKVIWKGIILRENRWAKGGNYMEVLGRKKNFGTIFNYFNWLLDLFRIFKGQEDYYLKFLT